MDSTVRDLIQSYSPSQKTIDLLRQKQLVILAGITAAGKDTIIKELTRSGDYHDLVTSTTRAPRANDGIMEVDGVDYHFLTMDQAVQKVKNREYVEVAVVHERINGLLASELQRAYDANKTPIIDVDVQGVDALERLSQSSAISIFLLPPSYEEWVSRMKRRYPTAEAFAEAWPVRRQSSIMELQTALEKPYYHFVVNENLADAVKVVDRLANKNDEFNQIDKSYHAWAENILNELLDKSAAEM